MWPWAHAALGYLLYTGLCRVRNTSPAGDAVIVLGVGTQLPDLVDKTLAWYVPVLPTGRTLAHSLLVAVPVIIAVALWLRSRDRAALGPAFGVGYLSHLLGDSAHAVVTAEWAELTFLLWPVLPSPEPELGKSLMAHLVAIEGSPRFLFGLLLTGVALAVWARDGLPGLETLWKLGRNALRRAPSSE